MISENKICWLDMQATGIWLKMWLLVACWRFHQFLLLQLDPFPSSLFSSSPRFWFGFGPMYLRWSHQHGDKSIKHFMDTSSCVFGNNETRFWTVGQLCLSHFLWTQLNLRVSHGAIIDQASRRSTIWTPLQTETTWEGWVRTRRRGKKRRLETKTTASRIQTPFTGDYSQQCQISWE